MAASSSDPLGGSDDGTDLECDSVWWERKFEEQGGTRQKTRGMPVEPPTFDEAERGLTDFMLDKHWEGRWSAEEICIVAYYVKWMGAKGTLAKLAKAPGDPSTGHYNEKLKTVTGLEDGDYEVVEVPGCDPVRPSSRAKVKVAMHHPHDSVNEECVRNPMLKQQLADLVARRALPKLYLDNPVAIASGYTAQPIVVYVDGVPTTRRDGVLAFWCYILHSDERRLICSIRKRRLCRCGCRGWCSIWPIWNHIKWSFRCLSLGEFPHDGATGRPLTAPWQLAVAGKEMQVIGSFYGFKADRLEFSGTFGLPPCSSKHAPCNDCMCTKNDWQAVEGWSPHSEPYPKFIRLTGIWKSVRSVRWQL